MGEVAHGLDDRLLLDEVVEPSARVVDEVGGLVGDTGCGERGPPHEAAEAHPAGCSDGRTAVAGIGMRAGVGRAEVGRCGVNSDRVRDAPEHLPLREPLEGVLDQAVTADVPQQLGQFPKKPRMGRVGRQAPTAIRAKRRVERCEAVLGNPERRASALCHGEPEREEEQRAGA